MLGYNNLLILSLSNNYRQLLIPNYTREEDEGDKSTIHNYYNAPIQQLTRQRKPRKQRYRKAYVPSTISSASESRYFCFKMKTFFYILFLVLVFHCHELTKCNYGYKMHRN